MERPTQLHGAVPCPSELAGNSLLVCLRCWSSSSSPAATGCLLQGPAGSTSPAPEPLAEREPGGTKEHGHWRLLTSATVRMKYIDGCCGSIPSSFIPTLKPFLCWEATWYWKQKLNYNVKPTQGVGSRTCQGSNHQAMGAAGTKRLWATGYVVIQISTFFP